MRISVDKSVEFEVELEYIDGGIELNVENIETGESAAILQIGSDGVVDFDPGLAADVGLETY